MEHGPIDTSGPDTNGSDTNGSDTSGSDTSGPDGSEGTTTPCVGTSVGSQRFAVRGWLEPETPSVPGAADTAAAFSARGQAAPFGRIRLVCTPAGPGSGRTPGSGWATVIVASGDSLYGSVTDDGAALAITVDGGTETLDGATGWMRVNPGDGTSAASVTGEIRVPGMHTSGPPAIRKDRLGPCERSDRGAIAGGA